MNLQDLRLGRWLRGRARATRQLHCRRASSRSTAASTTCSPRPVSCALSLAGRLRHEASSGADLPAVGDWVRASRRDRSTRCLPRRSAFARKVTVSADRGAGARREHRRGLRRQPRWTTTSACARIERYLTLAWESGAPPVARADEGRPLRRPARAAARGRAGRRSGAAPTWSATSPATGSTSSRSHLAPATDGRAARLLRRRQVDAR